MADVRSLLRAERANRRITHPHASYTSDGKLLCNLCETIVKSEAHWQSHLHSTQHNLRSQRAQEAKEARGAGKKRKAEDLDEQESESEEGRKKAKPGQSLDDVDALAGPHETIDDTDSIQPEQSKIQEALSTVIPDPTQEVVVEDEAAFARDLAAIEQELNEDVTNPALSALNAAATISATPMTAEELAAQAREEKSAQRGKRDAEIEGEREDAARLMQDELEEMEGLEERVKKLRERREALRTAASPGDGVGEQEGLEINGHMTEDEDDEDEEFEDEWRFGGG